MQPPESAQWPDVKGLLHGAADLEFQEFEKSFDFQPLELLPISDIPLHDGSLSTSIAEYVGPMVKNRKGDEKAVQPVIHSTLTCTALSAGHHTVQEFYSLLCPNPLFMRILVGG